jgi:phosphate transport system permease protein
VLRTSAKNTQRLALAFVWGTGAVALTILLTIVIYVFVRGLPEVGWSFLTTPPQGGLSGEGGISTVIVATVYLIGITMAILIPLGLGAAIYLAEYAPANRYTAAIRYGTEVLAGVPSIVFGLFGFVLFVTALHLNFSILSGSLTLACLLLPTLIRTSEEALRAVPRSHREAALALGATKWQTVWRVLLPAALPGIVTGIILCIGRAVGETACLYVTMGGSAGMPNSLLSSGRTLSMHLFYLAMDTNAIEKAMATGVILIAVIVITNAVTNWLSQRFRTRMMGGA